MTKKELCAYDLISGQEARNYRKKIAGFAEASKDKVQLTTKFKLDLAEVPSFDTFAKEYEIITGTGKGSLSYFLFTTVLSGFRLFTNAGLATSFARQQLLKDEHFELAVNKAFGIDLPLFRPDKIIDWLVEPHDSLFTKEGLQESLYQSFIDDEALTEEQQASVRRVFEAMSMALLPFGNWGSVQKNVEKACVALDESLALFGAFPALKHSLTLYNAVKLPKNSTIAFDKSSVVMDVPEEYLPYAVVASVMHYYQGTLDNQGMTSFVKNSITTYSHNVMSWLFGVGFEFIKTHTTDDIAEAYDIPQDKKQSAKRLKDAIESIPNSSWFGDQRYSAYRKVLGGHIDSWLSNYVNRLFELDALIMKLPEHLALPVSLLKGGQDFLDLTDCKREEVTLICGGFETIRESLKTALKTLMGEVTNQDELIQAVECINEGTVFLDRLCAIRNQILNTIEQVGKDEESFWADQLGQMKSEFASWSELKSLPKLNGFGGGLPNAEEELSAMLVDYQTILAAREQHWKRIEHWMQSASVPVNVLDRQMAIEKGHLTPNRTWNVTEEELAIRNLLDAFARIIRDRNDECAQDIRLWFYEKDIFASEKEANKFFFNHLGRIYVSPWSQRRHQGYRLGQTVVTNRDAIWQSLVDRLDAQPDFPAFSQASITKFDLINVLRSRIIQAIPQVIPHEVAQLSLADEHSEAIPVGLKLQLAQPTVEPSVFAKAFNLYASLLKGLQTKLRRERVYLRTQFTWVNHLQLAYCPKDKAWAIPERYFKLREWSTLLEEGLIHRDENGFVEVVKTFESIVKAKIKTWDSDLGKVLCELPHDWCYVLPYKVKTPSGIKHTVLKINTKKLWVKESIAQEELTRLIGPSSLKSRLDTLLVAPKVELGNLTLLVDQPICQKVDMDKAELVRETPVVSLAIPLTHNVQKADTTETKPFTRIVAIDQGEAGLAYAVFNLSDCGNDRAEPLTVGAIPIRSIRRLIKGVKRYRQTTQANQKFNQRFDSRMFTLRENVAGDVCGVIEGLMHRFNAIPVLEKEVKNLASGSKQLSLVYKMVNFRFLHGDVDMQNAQRRSWWFGADKWKIDGYELEVVKNDDSANPNGKKLGKKKIKYQPLYSYPGNWVNAAMTSRKCSHCGRNVFSLLDEVKKNGERTVHVNHDGEVQLQGEVLKLYQRPTKDDTHLAARKNERPDWTRPLKEQDMSIDLLQKTIYNNLRRPPKSLRSKDTTQSQYFCVFKDCEWNRTGYHADKNAAINIGRKFLAKIKRCDSK